jgi:hypothetical protein
MRIANHEGSEKLPLEAIGFITRLCYLRRKLKDGPFALSVLLVECAQSVASQPEDKVFSLQGIGDAAGTGDLKPNYNMKFQEVFREATIYTLQSGSFAVFTLAGTWSPKRPDLPSWVVDLSQPPKLYPLENGQSTYRAGGTEFKPSLIHSLDGNTISIDSFLVDEIKVVSQSEPNFGVGRD